MRIDHNKEEYEYRVNYSQTINPPKSPNNMIRKR